jgi:protein SCO1
MEDRLTASGIRVAPRHWAVLAAFGAILVVTAAWWGLALWPLPASAPAALLRARVVCFGSAEDGLPTVFGWMMLTGEPLMITLLLIGTAGDQTIRETLQWLAQRRAGRWALRAVTGVIAMALLAAGARVAWALDDASLAGVPPSYSRRIDRPAPALNLVDQHGLTVALERFAGRPALVTFAYAHCETVCPIVVAEVIRAHDRLPEPRPAIVVVTLDPWRDTPSRLPAMAALWGVPSDAAVVSGTVADVEAALDRWGVPRTRDVHTGEVSHPNLVYVLDGTGRIAYATSGDADAIVRVLGEL